MNNNINIPEYHSIQCNIPGFPIEGLYVQILLTFPYFFLIFYITRIKNFLNNF